MPRNYDPSWLAAKRAAQAARKAELESWKRGRVVVQLGAHKSLSTRGERGETWRTKKWTRSRRKELPASFAGATARRLLARTLARNAAKGGDRSARLAAARAA